MAEILCFEKIHIQRAKEIALTNYEEERAAVPSLPQIRTLPDFERFADNGLGVAMFDGGEMLGFLCCGKPWDNAYDSAAKGVFSPIHAHGSVYNDRGLIYKRLYQAAAEKWVNSKIAYHSVALYAHDSRAVNAFFTCGFGLRCVDAVMPLVSVEHQPCDEIAFGELAKADAPAIRDLRIQLSAHLGESPCFMRSSPESIQKWLNRAEKRESRLFVATKAGAPVAFIEVINDGENFATESYEMQNICGAFCLREYRGKGVVQGLLNYVISKLKEDGLSSLGVDFESFNPTASGFWLKYFTAYTSGVVRRIDECAFRD